MNKNIRTGGRAEDGFRNKIKIEGRKGTIVFYGYRYFFSVHFALIFKGIPSIVFFDVATFYFESYPREGEVTKIKSEFYLQAWEILRGF